jgi:hypothetical protein
LVLEQPAKNEKLENSPQLQKDLENNIDAQKEWVEKWSDKHNRKYWFNNKTNESTWIYPTNEKTNDSEWVEKWSDKHNRKYWYNNKTNKSTWDDPSLVKKRGKNRKTIKIHGKKSK